MSENFVSLNEKVRTPEDSVKYLQEKGIVKTETVCTKCEKVVSEMRKKNNFYFFRCISCDTVESIRSGTFLYGKVCYSLFFLIMYMIFSFQHISMKSFVLLVYMFICMPQISIAQVIHEVGHCIVLYRVSKTHGHMNACSRTFFLNLRKILIFKRRTCKTCNLSAFWRNLTKKFHIRETTHLLSDADSSTNTKKMLLVRKNSPG